MKILLVMLQEKLIFMKIHFPKIQFKSEFLRSIAKLMFRDRCEVEKVLVEIHNIDDPKSIAGNRGKFKGNGTEHFGVELTGGVKARIEYEIKKTNNKIVLLKFYKKMKSICNRYINVGILYTADGE